MHPRPINPPAPPYTIPAGSSVWLSNQLDLAQRWKPHRTRRRLDFDEVFSFHGPELLLFRVQEWVLAIPAIAIVHRPSRVIDALIFDIVHGRESNRQLIAWPDAYGRGEYTRPKRRRNTLLEVRAGQEILHRSEHGEQALVNEIRLGDHGTAALVTMRKLTTCGRRKCNSCNEDMRIQIHADPATTLRPLLLCHVLLLLRGHGHQPATMPPSPL